MNLTLVPRRRRRLWWPAAAVATLTWVALTLSGGVGTAGIANAAPAAVNVTVNADEGSARSRPPRTASTRRSGMPR